MIKQTISLLLAFVFLTLPVNAANIAGLLGGGRPPSGGAGTVLEFTSGGAFDGAYEWVSNSQLSGSFLTTSGFTCTRIELLLIKAGTVAPGTLTAAIYTAGTGPGTQVGTGSATVDRTTTTGSLAYYSFTGVNAVLSPATFYYVVVTASAPDTDASNAAFWVKQTGPAQVYGYNGSWSYIADGDMGFKLYSN